MIPRSIERSDEQLLLVRKDAAPPDDSIHNRLSECYKRAFTGRQQGFAVSGVLVSLIGTLSLALPIFFSRTIAPSGAALVCAGCAALAALPSATRIVALLISAFGALGIGAGIYLLQEPFHSQGNSGWFFAAYFTLAGLTIALLAKSQRSEVSHWFATSSVMNFNLAFVSLSGLPTYFLWTFSIFIGLHLLFYGTALLGASLANN